MNIAMYIRLSSSDEDTGFLKAESDSVVNQRLYISDFLDNHKTLSTHTRLEFVDDGFSGVYNDRPKLTEMLDMARSGKIDLICVKDFSRFFRDYIEAGNYLECVFPFLGVRFISINDNYDSDDYKGSTGGLEMVMRNIIYASYSKDLSIKTTTAREHMMKQGKFVGSHAPFGYIKHPKIKNKLALDNESAIIVRKIFDYAIDGKSTSEIAKSLNVVDTPTPAQYFKLKYPNNKKFNFKSDKISWTSAMVYLILTNERYTGSLVSGRKRKVANNVKKYVRQVPIIVENAHEAIVTKSEFELAGKVIKKSKDKGTRIANEFPLKSLVRCRNCGRLMRRKKGANGIYFECVYSNSANETGCPVNQKYSELEIEEKVLNAINLYVENFQDEVKIPKGNPVDKVNSMSDLQMQIDGIKKLKTRQYKQYVEEEISRDMFVKLKADCDNKIAELETQIEVLSKEKIPVVTNSKTASLINLFSSRESFTNEIAKAFIKSIYIYDDESIEIEWNFKDNLTEV